MSNNKLKLLTNNIAYCIIYGIVGLLLIILQGGSLGVVMTVAGALLIVLGILDIVNNKDLTKGIIQTVIGVLIIIFGWLVAGIVLLFLGILLIIKGTLEILDLYNNGIMAIVPSVITIVIGVLFVIAKWTTLDVICIITGVILIVNAILLLFNKK